VLAGLFGVVVLGVLDVRIAAIEHGMQRLHGKLDGLDGAIVGKDLDDVILVEVARETTDKDTRRLVWISGRRR